MSKSKNHIEKMEELLADLRARELEEKQPILEELQKLYQEQPDETTALIYAKGLFNLTVDQNLEGCEQTVERLANLSSRFPADSAIALRYAKCLLKLTVAQDLEGCEHTVKELANLSSRFPADSSIALAYAKGLVNLSIVKESSEELIGISDKLEELFKRFPKSSEIAEQTSRLQLIIGEKSEGDEATKVAFAQALSYMNTRLPENNH